MLTKEFLLKYLYRKFHVEFYQLQSCLHDNVDILMLASLAFSIAARMTDHVGLKI